MHEVGISPLLRRIEKLDVHRNSNFMSLIALNALQIKIEPVSLLEIVRSLSGCLNQPSIRYLVKSTLYNACTMYNVHYLTSNANCYSLSPFQLLDF